MSADHLCAVAGRVRWPAAGLVECAAADRRRAGATGADLRAGRGRLWRAMARAVGAVAWGRDRSHHLRRVLRGLHHVAFARVGALVAGLGSDLAGGAVHLAVGAVARSVVDGRRRALCRGVPPAWPAVSGTGPCSDRCGRRGRSDQRRLGSAACVVSLAWDCHDFCVWPAACLRKGAHRKSVELHPRPRAVQCRAGVGICPVRLGLIGMPCALRSILTLRCVPERTIPNSLAVMMVVEDDVVLMISFVPGVCVLRLPWL